VWYVVIASAALVAVNIVIVLLLALNSRLHDDD
jgi:hypothetical protein